MFATPPDLSVAPPSADHGQALAEGRRLAAFTGRATGSADVLLGLLRAGGAASRLLAERGVNAAKLEAFLHQVSPEPGFDLTRVATMSQEIAQGLGAQQTSSLHLLLALLRIGAGAVDLLRLSGQDPQRLRAFALRGLTGPARVGERARVRPASGDGPPVAARSPSVLTPVPAVPIRALAVAPAAVAPEIEGPRALASTLAARLAPSSGLSEIAPLAPPDKAVLFRERELGRLLDLLQSHNDRILCVVGEPGSGRSTLLAAFAQALPDPPVAPTGAPSGGLSPGAFIEQLDRAAPLGVAIVLDGCGYVMTEGSDAPAQLLATARAGRRWVLSAGPADLRRLESAFPDLAERLETVVLSPLLGEALAEVVQSGLDHLAEIEGVSFSDEMSGALLRLSSRYPSELGQPGRGLTIAAVAAARATRLGFSRVGEEQVAQVVADAADIPVARLLRSDDERFRTLEDRLAARVVGHAEARARIADVFRRSYAGFRGHRPLASLLLLGPTGVGKTETARAIADALFDGEASLLRIDLSEYNEPHAIARLIGSPPGYVGYEEGGQLTEGIRRRPASVVLLDELEKAHPEILMVLLQILEDGRLTDGRGRTVDFSSSAVVMTSNLGSEHHRRGRAPAPRAVLGSARAALPPELWNRIDEVLCYAPLKENELADILRRFARQSSQRLLAERGVRFEVGDDVLRAVLAAENDRTLGARPLRRAFERLVLGPIARWIVGGNARARRLQVGVNRRGEITVTPE